MTAETSDLVRSTNKFPPEIVVRLPPTGLINPFVVPGPEITAFSIPLVSEAPSEYSTPDSGDSIDLGPIMTTGFIHPVERPGPVGLPVPPPVLSRVSEMKNNARAVRMPTTTDAIVYSAEAPTLTTLATSSPYVVEKLGPLIFSIDPAIKSRLHHITPRAAAPSVTTYPPILVGVPYNSSDSEPAPQTQGVDAAKVGWIIAIVVACFMTGFGIWLILRNFSARKRRRAASVRGSQGTEMMRSGVR